MRAPRMRWTTTLHARFVHAVELLGGHESNASHLSILCDFSLLYDVFALSFIFYRFLFLPAKKLALHSLEVAKQETKREENIYFFLLILSFFLVGFFRSDTKVSP